MNYKQLFAILHSCFCYLVCPLITKQRRHFVFSLLASNLLPTAEDLVTNFLVQFIVQIPDSDLFCLTQLIVAENCSEWHSLDEPAAAAARRLSCGNVAQHQSSVVFQNLHKGKREKAASQYGVESLT